MSYNFTVFEKRQNAIQNFAMKSICYNFGMKFVTYFKSFVRNLSYSFGRREVFKHGKCMR